MSVNFEIPIYGLTELGKKISMGIIHRTVEGTNLVGGKIFYIDETSTGGTYTFYDREGDIIPSENIVPGFEPFAYKVEGTPTKDKFYVFNNQLLTSKVWSYQKEDSWVYTLLNTKAELGEGRNNTNIVMAADEGAYTTQANSIWHFLDIANGTDKPGGCDDWFVPSKAEVDLLRTATDPEDNPLVTWFTNNYIWSSSEDTEARAWRWVYTSQTWAPFAKYYNYGVFWARAF